jgi:hypothetical protein
LLIQRFCNNVQTFSSYFVFWLFLISVERANALTRPGRLHAQTTNRANVILKFINGH